MRGAHVDSVPPPPQRLAQFPFSEELRAWQRILAAREVAQKALRVLCNWSVTTSIGDGSSAVTTRGTETIYAQPDAKKLAILFESGTAPKRTIRRIVCDGDTVLGVRFDEDSGKSRRSATRVYLSDAEGDLERAVGALGLDLVGATRLAELVLQTAHSPKTRLALLSDGRVLEFDPPSRRAQPQRIRRYTFSPTTAALLVFEEWVVRQEAPRPARRNRPADTGQRVTYRREEYKPAPPASAFSTALPEGYALQSVQPKTRTDVRVGSVDPEALQRIERWRRVDQRWLSLHLMGTVTTTTQKRTDDSPDPANRQRGPLFNATYAVWIRRPGLARVEVQSPEGFPPPQTITSDGLNVTITGAGRGPRTRPLDNPERLAPTVLAIAERNALDPLAWFLSGPPNLQQFESVRGLGSQVLPSGMTVDVVELTVVERTATRNEQQSTTTTTYQIGFAPDGFPRAIVTTVKSDIAGRFERDQPAVQTRRVLVTLETDRTPPL